MKNHKTGITGGIGSGKSYVCRAIERMLGIEVYDCDREAKRLIRTSAEIRNRLTALIGPDAYRSDGTLDKAAVSRFLLASPSNQEAINAIVHPAVISDFEQSGRQWIESALLFQCGLEQRVGRVVAVVAPEELRIERIMQRDGITRDKALQWIRCQLPQDEVARRADIVIVNDGNGDLEAQIREKLNIDATITLKKESPYNTNTP